MTTFIEKVGLPVLMPEDKDAPGSQRGKERAWKARVTAEVAACLVAAELWRQEFVVSLTNRNVPDVDLLAASDRGRGQPVSIQVKANSAKYANQQWWTISDRPPPSSPDYFFVFVSLRGGWEKPGFFVVPSAIVSENRRSWRKWVAFPGTGFELSPFADQWDSLRRKSVD